MDWDSPPPLLSTMLNLFDHSQVSDVSETNRLGLYTHLCLCIWRWRRGGGGGGGVDRWHNPPPTF